MVTSGSARPLLCHVVLSTRRSTQSALRFAIDSICAEGFNAQQTTFRRLWSTASHAQVLIRRHDYHHRLKVGTHGPCPSIHVSKECQRHFTSKTVNLSKPASAKKDIAASRSKETASSIDYPWNITPSTNTSHNSLASFLEYAERTNLSPRSTVYLGTRYEYLVQEHLQTHLSFSLNRIGGRNDSGIDLLGGWHLPGVLERHQHQRDQGLDANNTQLAEGFATAQSQQNQTAQTSESTHKPPIPVLIQCKRLLRPTPTLIRELEGSFLAIPARWKSPSSSPSSSSSSSSKAEPRLEAETDIGAADQTINNQVQHQYQTLGILVCTRPATKGIREAMQRSRRGLAWITLDEDETETETEIGKEEEEEEEEEEEKERTPPSGSGTSGIARASSTTTTSPKTKTTSNSGVPLADKIDLYEEDDHDHHPPPRRVIKTRIRQFLWNRAAVEMCGLQGLDVGLKRAVDGVNHDEVTILWQGIPVRFRH